MVAGVPSGDDFTDGYRRECWRCGGTGQEPTPFVGDHTWSCGECEGTGSREYARLERARRIGWQECLAMLNDRDLVCSQVDPARLVLLVDMDEQQEQMRYLRERLARARGRVNDLAGRVEIKENELGPREQSDNI